MSLSLFFAKQDFYGTLKALAAVTLSTKPIGIT